MDWTTKELYFNSWWGLEIFLFFGIFRVALGHFQLPIQWVLGGRKLTNHLCLVPRLKRHGALLSLLHIAS
jgi:hypothetical protein